MVGSLGIGSTDVVRNLDFNLDSSLDSSFDPSFDFNLEFVVDGGIGIVGRPEPGVIKGARINVGIEDLIKGEGEEQRGGDGGGEVVGITSAYSVLYFFSDLHIIDCTWDGSNMQVQTPHFDFIALPHTILTIL